VTQPRYPHQVTASTPNPAQQPILTTDEVATRLRVSAKTVRRWVRDGLIVAFKPSGEWRYRIADVDAFEAARRNVPAPSRQEGTP
jgi:DNA binding domain, excisionase family